MSVDVGSLRVTAREGGVRFAIRVKPRAGRDGVSGVREGQLEVSVTAPPVEGQANGAVVAVLAARLRVAKRAVRIVTGETGRQKIVEVDGLQEPALRAMLEAP
jgi:hypothetical protein